MARASKPPRAKAQAFGASAAAAKLTHLDAARPSAHGRRVRQSPRPSASPSPKAPSSCAGETLDLVVAGNAEKGDVLGAARIAGIMAAKRTHELIPLCHPLPITKVADRDRPGRTLPGLRVAATVKVTGQTGVEMEALTAVSVACLTIYDMVKAVERGMRIEGIRLLEKSGGKSGHYRAEELTDGV